MPKLLLLALLPYFSWTVASLGVENARGRVPRLDIESSCRDVSKMDLNQTTNYDGCINDENDARAQVQERWASVSPGMQAQCLQLVTRPALPSYVTLQECLNTSEEARKLPPGDSSIANTFGAKK